jgi:hypothetical protein
VQFAPAEAEIQGKKRKAYDKGSNHHAFHAGDSSGFVNPGIRRHLS